MSKGDGPEEERQETPLDSLSQGNCTIRGRDVEELSKHLLRIVNSAPLIKSGAQAEHLGIPFLRAGTLEAQQWMEKLSSDRRIDSARKVAAILTDDHSCPVYDAALNSGATIIELGRIICFYALHCMKSEPLLLVLWGYSTPEINSFCRRLVKSGYTARKRISSDTRSLWKHKKRMIADPGALKKFIDAVMRSQTTQLDEDGEKLAKRVLSSLESKPSVKAIAVCLSRLPNTSAQKNPWFGRKTTTILDNYNRPKGRASRR